MDIKKSLIPLLFFGVFQALIRQAFNNPAAVKSTAKSASFAEIDAFVERERRRLKMPCVSLAIVEGDQIVHQRGFGRARPGGAAPTPQTPFYIASLTKSFTALAVMQLVEAGKIALDDPVQRYLPWFRVADPQASAQMTLRHLLNQTSGLPNVAGEIPLADFDDSPGATERQMRALSTLLLTRPPGAAFEYSNANYSLLGLVIEAAGGEPYFDYVQKHICSPLGMRQTYISRTRAKAEGLAVGHQYWFGWPFPAPDMPTPHGSLPAALLISTAEDLAHYLIAYLNGGRYGQGQILSEAGIEELYRGVADIEVMGQNLGQYGMGWFATEIGRSPLVWHSGTLPDFAAYMAILPEQGKGVVMLFNADHHWMNPVLAEFGTGVGAMLVGETPETIPFVPFIPWLLRGQLLIPALQIAGVITTLDLIRRWRRQPGRRPRCGSAWGLYILLPLIPNLLLTLTLRPLLGKRRGYLRLYMPEYPWIAMICGGFALVWSFLRTGLVLRALKKPSPPPSSLEG